MEEGKWWQRGTGEDWGTDVYHIFCVVVVTWLFTFVKHYLSTETNTVWYHLYVESKKNTSSVQLLSRVRLFATPWTTACQASLSIANTWSLLKLMSIESVVPSNHLILHRPLLLPPSIFPSIRVFSNESALRIRWLKYWSFSFSISPSNENQDWFPLRWTGWISFQSKGLSRVFSNTTVQSTNSSVLSFIYNQFSHPYMTTGKTIALTRWNFVGKVMSLLFNMLYRLVITLLPRSKCLLISWLQSPSAVILEPRKIKSATVSTLCPSIKWWD